MPKETGKHSLFEENQDQSAMPLAARMRPRSLDEFVGQDHIVGPGRLLRRAIAADQLSSLIFYGPPGTGKTTLARVIAGNTKSRFVTLNAVLTGVADIRREISEACGQRSLQGRRTILFVDEVHRWNKGQQDALLPWVENGTVILIGATTENPYFEVNKALVSRSRVFQLRTLKEADLADIARQALRDRERGYGRWSVDFASGALEHLVHVASGDARSLLGALQLAVETGEHVFPPPEGQSIRVSLEAAEESIQRKVVLYDKEGDYHFDTISAFIKSIRGSDPDAALYWLALMVRAGEDPRYIFRRMLISASEDVGLAAPEALGVVESCAAAFDRVGLPEGQFHLTQACLYLSVCAKSNSALGYFDALKSIDEERGFDVPNHLRDSSRDKEAFGHGEGYKYPHAWQEHWVAQQYLPSGLAGRVFYQPGGLGYEGRVRDLVVRRRQAQVASMVDADDVRPPEVFSYSPGGRERERWLRRTESGSDKSALAVRDCLLAGWNAARHHRVLIASDPGAVLTWEAALRVPEGGVSVLCPNDNICEVLKAQAAELPPVERPLFLVGSLSGGVLPDDLNAGGVLFDAVLGRNLLARAVSNGGAAHALEASARLAAGGASMFLAEPRPGSGTSPGSLMPDMEDQITGRYREAEAAVLAEFSAEFNADSLTSLLHDSPWSLRSLRETMVSETRVLSPGLLEVWFDHQVAGSYASRMAGVLGETVWTDLAARLKILLGGREARWQSGLFVIHAESDGEPRNEES